MCVFSLATMAMGGAPPVWKRVLITPRGLVNRRNGAETALAGMADCEILCDNSARVLPAVASVRRRRAIAPAPTTFSSVSSENRLKCLAW